jgi:hypothetical protein
MMGNGRKKNILLLVLHEKDLYQENDAFVHHHDIVQLLDFRKTLNPVQFVLVNYKYQSEKKQFTINKSHSTNFAANNCETLAKVLSGRRLFPDADVCIADDEGAGTSPLESCTFIADCILIFLNVCNNLMSILSCGVSRNNQRLK